jgi:hypothetical protein
MPPKRTTRSSLLALLVGALAGLASAQPPTGLQPVWTLAQFHSRIDRNPAWTTTAASESDAPPAGLGASPSSYSFGPFEERKYGFGTIRAIVQTVPLTEQERLYPADGRTKLRIYLEVRSAGGSRWSALFPTQPSGEGLFLSYTKVDVEPATADRGLPILAISVETESDQTLYVPERSVLMVDLRAGQPKLLGEISGDYGYGRGSCNALDYAYEPFRTVGCRWDPNQADFVCEVTKFRRLTWTSRTVVSLEWLTLHAVVPGPKPADVAPEDLTGLAQRTLNTDSTCGTATVLRGSGSVTCLAKWRGPAIGDHLALFGAQARGVSFTPRLFLASTGPDSALETSEIEVYTLGRSFDLDKLETDPSVWWPDFDASGTPAGPSPSFVVEPLAGTATGLRVLRLVVTEGRARGLFLVAIDSRIKPVKTEAIRLATDSTEDWHCGRVLHPASLFPAGIVPDPFSLRADVEPAHSGFFPSAGAFNVLDDAAGGPGVDRLATLTWDPREGFVLELREVPAAPRTTVRLPQIQPDGTVSAHEVNVRYPPGPHQ